jgi:hypothetical protein
MDEQDEVQAIGIRTILREYLRQMRDAASGLFAANAVGREKMAHRTG